MRLIPQESYWTFKGPPTPDEPPFEMAGDWFALSPSMRREIWRDHERRMKPKEEVSEQRNRDLRREYLDRKTEVQLAARERL
jgi:hypothetical protein